MNLNPISQANIKPWWTAANSVMLFDVSPKWREKPEIHSLELFLKRPPAPANLGFPIALPSVLEFNVGVRGNLPPDKLWDFDSAVVHGAH